MVVKEVQDRNLNGIILMGGNFEYTNEDFKRLGVPCVLLTVSAVKDVDKDLYSSVIIDYEAESFKATEYLIQVRTQKNRLYIQQPGRSGNSQQTAFCGIPKALEAHGIAYDPVLVFLCITTYKT